MEGGEEEKGWVKEKREEGVRARDGWGGKSEERGGEHSDERVGGRGGEERELGK